METKSVVDKLLQEAAFKIYINGGRDRDEFVDGVATNMKTRQFREVAGLATATIRKDWKSLGFQEKGPFQYHGFSRVLSTDKGKFDITMDIILASDDNWGWYVNEVVVQGLHTDNKIHLAAKSIKSKITGKAVADGIALMICKYLKTRKTERV